MISNFTKNIFKFLLIIFLFLILINSVFAQGFFPTMNEEVTDPRTWRYFRIDAKTDDDSLFVKIQDQLSISPYYAVFSIIVNLTDRNNATVIIGDELDSPIYSWGQLSQDVQEGLVNWRGINKYSLTRRAYNYASPFWESLKRIKISDLLAPVKKKYEANSTLCYINPYIQLFGGEKFGYPFKESFGFNFGIGNKYSGPFESDQISAGINYYGFSANYISRINGLNTHKLNPKSNKDISLWQQYNNIFSPSDAVELTYILPIGSFLKIGYVYTFGNFSESGPAEYTFYENSVTNKPMPNYYVNGNYLNYEIKYQFRLLRATRSELYLANYFNEYHLGIISREMTTAGCIFDFRTNFTFSSKRNFQFLFEYLFSGISESFGLSALALGPSFRFTKLDNGKFGLHTFFINVRFQIKHKDSGL